LFQAHVANDVAQFMDRLGAEEIYLGSYARVDRLPKS
jgi:hypothetical protein